MGKSQAALGLVSSTPEYRVTPKRRRIDVYAKLGGTLLGAVGKLSASTDTNGRSAGE